MNRHFSIYCAHQISGLSQEEVLTYYEKIAIMLNKMGYKVLHPMTGKGILRTDVKFKAESQNNNPISMNHSIKERDQWMVRMADVILTDLTNTTTVSIGCVGELAWGDILGKHTVVVMSKDNIHNHAFIREMADIIFETLDEALEYLEKLIDQRV
jgi:hypothetical protein